MRAKDFIIESEGGMLRRAEEAGRGKRVSFKNNAGNVIDMIDAVIIPEVETELEPGELTAQLTAFASANGIATADFKTLPATTGLSTPDKAGIAMAMVFQDAATGKRVGWIALKAKRKPGAYPFFLQTKLFSDLTGYQQLSAKKGEEDKISGVQQRALTNLKPVGIIPTNTEIAIDDISKRVKETMQGRDDLSDIIKQQVVQLLDAVSSGSTNPVPGAGEFAKSYEIDLGETAAPISLVKKKFLSGAWQQAEVGMNVKFQTATGVEFPNDPAEKLYDSYLKFGEQIIRVSSKDKSGGAKASVSGVVDDISNYPDRYEGLFDPATNPGFDKLLEIVKIIKNPDMGYVSNSKQWRKNGSIAGALQLGVTTRIINSDQARKILTIIDSDQPHISEEELGDLKSVLKLKGTDDSTRPDYRIGWHLLAAVAAGAADNVNKKYRTDAFFKAVLERSNMLQIKTSLVQKSVEDAEGNQTNGAYFSNFEVIYPPVFTGTIRLDAGSNFYATRRPVGKMGFAIK